MEFILIGIGLIIAAPLFLLVGWTLLTCLFAVLIALIRGINALFKSFHNR